MDAWMYIYGVLIVILRMPIPHRDLDIMQYSLGTYARIVCWWNKIKQAQA